MSVKSNEVFAAGIVVFFAGLVASIMFYNAATTGRLDTLVIGGFFLAIVLVQIWALQRARHRTRPRTRREKNLATRRMMLACALGLSIALVSLLYTIWTRAETGASTAGLLFLAVVAAIVAGMVVFVLVGARAIRLNPDKETYW